MFAGIAGRYDLANHLLSGGLDFFWRRRLVRMARDCNPQTVLDLATGSGDVAFALRNSLDDSVSITGMDFCQPMLDEAERKKSNNPNIRFKLGDCLNLPLEENSVDLITIAFGLRNLEDRHRGLCEMRRVLKPGGTLLILEFTQPAKIFRPFYFFYLKFILPALAGLVTRNKRAYEYLAGSIENFPSIQNITSEMQRAGFHDITACGLTFCAVAIHRGKA